MGISLFSSVKQEVGVEGMKCEHCEAHMKEAFMKIEGVKEVVADRSKNLVSVKSKKGISEAQAKEAVESCNKTFLGIKTLK